MQYWQSVQFPLDDVLRPISPIVYTKLITATFQVVSLQALLKSIVWHIMKLEPLAGPYLANMADASLKSKVFFSSPHSFSFKAQVFRESFWATSDTRANNRQRRRKRDKQHENQEKSFNSRKSFTIVENIKIEFLHARCKLGQVRLDFTHWSQDLVFDGFRCVTAMVAGSPHCDTRLVVIRKSLCWPQNIKPRGKESWIERHLVERDNWWFENPEKLKTEGIKLDWVNDDDKKVEATHCDILNTI